MPRSRKSLSEVFDMKIEEPKPMKRKRDRLKLDLQEPPIVYHLPQLENVDSVDILMNHAMYIAMVKMQEQMDYVISAEIERTRKKLTCSDGIKKRQEKVIEIARKKSDAMSNIPRSDKFKLSGELLSSFKLLLHNDVIKNPKFFKLLQDLYQQHEQFYGQFWLRIDIFLILIINTCAEVLKERSISSTQLSEMSTTSESPENDELFRQSLFKVIRFCKKLYLAQRSFRQDVLTNVQLRLVDFHNSQTKVVQFRSQKRYQEVKDETDKLVKDYNERAGELYAMALKLKEVEMQKKDFIEIKDRRSQIKEVELRLEELEKELNNSDVEIEKCLKAELEYEFFERPKIVHSAVTRSAAFSSQISEINKQLNECSFYKKQISYSESQLNSLSEVVSRKYYELPEIIKSSWIKAFDSAKNKIVEALKRRDALSMEIAKNPQKCRHYSVKCIKGWEKRRDCIFLEKVLKFNPFTKRKTISAKERIFEELKKDIEEARDCEKRSFTVECPLRRTSDTTTTTTTAVTPNSTVQSSNTSSNAKLDVKPPSPIKPTSVKLQKTEESLKNNSSIPEKVKKESPTFNQSDMHDDFHLQRQRSRSPPRSFRSREFRYPQVIPVCKKVIDNSEGYASSSCESSPRNHSYHRRSRTPEIYRSSKRRSPTPDHHHSRSRTSDLRRRSRRRSNSNEHHYTDAYRRSRTPERYHRSAPTSHHHHRSSRLPIRRSQSTDRSERHRTSNDHRHTQTKSNSPINRRRKGSPRFYDKGEQIGTPYRYGFSNNYYYESPRKRRKIEMVDNDDDYDEVFLIPSSTTITKSPEVTLISDDENDVDSRRSQPIIINTSLFLKDIEKYIDLNDYKILYGDMSEETLKSFFNVMASSNLSTSLELPPEHDTLTSLNQYVKDKLEGFKEDKIKIVYQLWMKHLISLRREELEQSLKAMVVPDLDNICQSEEFCQAQNNQSICTIIAKKSKRIRNAEYAKSRSKSDKCRKLINQLISIANGIGNLQIVESQELISVEEKRKVENLLRYNTDYASSMQKMNRILQKYRSNADRRLGSLYRLKEEVNRANTVFVLKVDKEDSSDHSKEAIQDRLKEKRKKLEELRRAVQEQTQAHIVDTLEYNKEYMQLAKKEIESSTNKTGEIDIVAEYLLKKYKEKIYCQNCSSEERLIDCIFTKCNHFICEVCAKEILASSNKSCPQCNGKVKEYRKVYF